MPDWSELKGKAGSSAEQLFLWAVLNQVVASLLAPLFRQLEYTINHAGPNVVLSPADIATAINRSFMSHGDGVTEANASGIDEARLNILQHLAGNAPAPEALAAMLRRGIIPADGTGPEAVSFRQGIAEGNLLNKWGDAVQEAEKAIPSPSDIVEAGLKGQLSAADALALFLKVGGDPKYYQLLINIAGNPPSPTELINLANRGIIPWTGTGPDVLSVQQGIFEGRTKDKWYPAYKPLGEYRPPPETVRAMLEANGITVEQASAYWASYGMTPETIAQYIQTANNSKNQAAQGLTETAVLQMYYAQLISKDDAVKFLSLMGIDASNATLLIAYTDMQRSIEAVTKAVSRLQTLYTARKITQQTAQDALARLQVPGVAIDGLITTWNIIASANVRVLTEAQIADAFFEGILTQDQAQGELEALGYTPFDAWVLLSIKNKGALPGQPSAQIGTPLGAVTPGVT